MKENHVIRWLGATIDPELAQPDEKAYRMDYDGTPVLAVCRWMRVREPALPAMEGAEVGHPLVLRIYVMDQPGDFLRMHHADPMMYQWLAIAIREMTGSGEGGIGDPVPRRPLPSDGILRYALPTGD